MATVVVYIILGAMVFGVLTLFYKSGKKWFEIRDAKENGLVKYSAIYAGLLKHVEGLPIARGSVIEFYYGREKITFKKDNQEISLDRSKIINMESFLGEDAKSQAAAGAVAGKYLLGGLGGAVIGAMMATTFYLSVIYNNGEENKTILLDTTGSDLPLKKILSDFKSNNQTETKRIEL